MFQEFVGRVVNADCLAALPQMPAESVDLVVTDPPYLARYRDRQGRRVANDDRAENGYGRPLVKSIGC